MVSNMSPVKDESLHQNNVHTTSKIRNKPVEIKGGSSQTHFIMMDGYITDFTDCLDSMDTCLDQSNNHVEMFQYCVCCIQ